jgi:hypothetical protein
MFSSEAEKYFESRELKVALIPQVLSLFVGYADLSLIYSQQSLPFFHGPLSALMGIPAFF